MYILGFTDEDVTGCWQHWRLATEFGSAFESEQLPPSFGVLEAPGRGAYLIEWYVSPDAAAVLDRHGVSWRRFLVAESEVERRGAYPPLIPATPEQRRALEERRRASRK